MQHLFKQGKKDKPTLLLLHGTGGNEYDLLPLADIVDRDASVLSVRGEVLENGMPRFFRRLAEGVFDEEDVVSRTKQLYEFLDGAAKEYDFDSSNVIAIGYSNGANIAASLLYHYKDSLKGAILHHPMVPRRGIGLPDLSGTFTFIAAGKNDPICPTSEPEELYAALEQAGSDVTIYWEYNGHSLSRSETVESAKWYETHV